MLRVAVCDGVRMDAITALALQITVAAVIMYLAYWTIRKAVAAGIRDAAERAAGPAADDHPQAESGPVQPTSGPPRRQ